MIDKKLLSLLVCPLTQAPLTLSSNEGELFCAASGLAYPIRDGIPIMLEDEARQLSEDEKASVRAKHV